MKKRILSILLILCMVLALCPVAVFAETPSQPYTVTRNFKYGTLLFAVDGATYQTSPYTEEVKGGNPLNIGAVIDCAPYKFVGWKETGSGKDYAAFTYVTVTSNLTFEAVYEVDGNLAITVDGFEVGKTPADCTYSFESTIPGIEFSAADIKNVCWEEFVFYGSDYTTSVISNTDVFEADTRYQVLFDLNNKGLDMAPAVTVNGKTPEFCAIATSSGVPIRLQITCTLGTPAEPPAPSLVIGDIDLDGEVTVKDAIMLQDCLENPESFEKLTSKQYKAADFNGDGRVTESDLTALRSFLNLITIDGPDVVCAQQDYEFTVTPPAGVTLDKEFGYDTGMKGGGADLTVDADGVGHGTVLTEWYDLNTGSFTLNAHGTTADGTPVTGTKTVQVSPEHIFVDGVCGCGAVQQYTVTYDGGEGSDPVTDVKTHGKDLTLRGETFTMDGFVQTGWVDGQGAVYKLGATYTADRDVTLYPYWEKLITVTAPFTTTVELSDVGVPGEKTFTLALIGDSAPDKDKSNVTITGSVTTNGKGSYNGTLTFTGTERTLWVMLSEGAFVQQVDDGEAGWTVDDTVWGVLMEEIPVAYAMGDDANASGYTVYVVPASIDGNGYYYIDWENLQAADMAFTNTYTAHDYALKHDATHHWDECACKDVQNKELHKYGDWKVTKEASQTAKGEKEHTCTVCGYTEKVEIPKLGTVNTGDNNSFALWAALFTLSAAAVTVTVSAGKKKKADR